MRQRTWFPRRRLWPLAVLLVLGAVALVPGLGVTGTVAPRALWSETPPHVAPAAVTAPNWVALAGQAKQAVVNVSTRRAEDGPEGLNPFFEQFFGRRPRRTIRSLGSGFVINHDGYIVTNNHVVDGATEIRVKLSDAREFPARLVGRDPRTDLALLRIEARDLTAIPLGDSSALRVGEPVMAIGNPFGLEQTVTTGIVSATGRVIGEGPYDDFIQTDASINPGNSGGPLLNAQGLAVGINSAIFSQSGGSVGIGFAIPINAAKPVVTQLAGQGEVTRGWLGVAIQAVTPDLAKSFGLAGLEGALVTSVIEGSPAARAGLRAGDVIVEYGGRKLGRASDLPRAVADTTVGQRAAITVMRNGKTEVLTATIARLEDTRRAAVQTDDVDQSMLGISGQTITPAVAQQLGIAERHGVLVVAVRDGSRADKAGLRPGDVITEVDRRAVDDARSLAAALRTHDGATPVLLLVHRDGDALWLAVGA